MGYSGEWAVNRSAALFCACAESACVLRCVCHSAIDVESHGAVGIQTLANCLALSMLSSSGLLVAQAGQEHSTPVDRQTPPADWELESSPDPLHKSAEVPGDELGFAQSAAAAHLSATLGSRPARSRQSHSALRSLEEHFDSDGHEPAERCDWPQRAILRSPIAPAAARMRAWAFPTLQSCADVPIDRSRARRFGLRLA